MKNTTLSGHIAAFLTIFIWGTTFVSTKVLLQVLSPMEILCIRFLIGYLALWCVCPRRLTVTDKKQEWTFAAAGLCGITLYYLFENIALNYTLATNVGVIISIAPFFTAIFTSVFLGGERPDLRFFCGFFIAMAGICLISFQGGSGLQINPLGDLLAVGAAVIWAAYSTITKKVSGFGYNTILATRRTFFYGLLFMIPAAGIFGLRPSGFWITDGTVLANLLFLGFGASALCFVTWNFAVKHLGSVKTSVYIYMVPVITAVTSGLVLRESMSGLTVGGILLTLMGLFLSEKRRTDESINFIYGKRE